MLCIIGFLLYSYFAFPLTFLQPLFLNIWPFFTIKIGFNYLHLRLGYQTKDIWFKMVFLPFFEMLISHFSDDGGHTTRQLSSKLQLC